MTIKILYYIFTRFNHFKLFLFSLLFLVCRYLLIKLLLLVNHILYVLGKLLRKTLVLSLKNRENREIILSNVRKSL